MHSLTHTAQITETAATEAIFNACCANETRADRGNVTFRQFINGNEWEAVLRDASGTVVAMATVDKFDV